MLTYALGRGVEPADMPVVRRIVKKAAQNDYRVRVDRHGYRRERAVPDADQAGAGRNRQQRRTSESGVAMIITKKHLSRRTFLRGTFGATVALPLLDAMVPALTAQSRTAASSPFRFGAIYMPNGVFPDTWHPEEAGSDFQFKPVMQPLEPFRDQLVTVSKMKAPWGASVHLGASSAFLNGVGPVGTREGTGDAFGKIQSKKTVDQYIADKVAGDTPLRSIEVGTEDMGTAVGACDGFPCTFFNALSWRDDTSPLPVGINPRVTFERMFGETGSTEQRAARLKEKQSLLDSVTQETAKLRRTLGAPDRAILDEYLSNIRQVEQQLDRMESRLGTITGNPEAPVGLPEAFDDHMTVTYNLMHLAFQGDISRVFTFMIGHEASDRGYAHIGIPETHHSISHHGNDPEKLAKYAKIGTYQIVKFARVPREAEGDARWRRDAAGSLAALLGQRHEQRQRARSEQPARGAGRRRARPAEGQSSHRREEGRADREPAARDGAPGRRGDRESRSEHRPPRPVGRSERRRYCCRPAASSSSASAGLGRESRPVDRVFVNGRELRPDDVRALIATYSGVAGRIVG